MKCDATKAEAAMKARAMKAPEGEPEGISEATIRDCTFQLTNQWGVKLVSVMLRHLRGNDPDTIQEKTWFDLETDATTPADDELNVTYETGIGAGGDYWWVKFVTETGETYSSKDSFYCDLTSDDEDGLGTASVDGQGGVLTIQPPESGSCSTSSINSDG